MSEPQGYYCLVQYADVPERAEFVNIGVILFVPSRPYVLSKFSERPRRAERAFGVYLGSHFQLIQSSLRDRLSVDFGEGWTRESIDMFAALRSGKIRLSSSRSVLVKDGNMLIDELFERFVGDTPRKKRGPRPATKLAQIFRDFGVEKLLVKPEPVLLSGGVKVEAPFAYQNGSFNMIDAISLSGNPDKVLNRASPRMIEGELLFEETALANPKQLIVIGEEADEQEDDFLRMVSEQMARHHVKFHTMSDLNSLVADIRQNFARYH